MDTLFTGKCFSQCLDNQHTGWHIEFSGVVIQILQNNLNCLVITNRLWNTRVFPSITALTRVCTPYYVINKKSVQYPSNVSYAKHTFAKILHRDCISIGSASIVYTLVLKGITIQHCLLCNCW